MYRLSALDEMLQNLPLQYHLVGDSAYTLSTHMMVPYWDNNNLSAAQRSFNYKHLANRMTVEHAFGHLKMKFPRIHNCLEVRSWKRVVMIINCCVYLHNFIELSPGTPVDELSVPNLPENKDEKRAAIKQISLSDC